MQTAITEGILISVKSEFLKEYSNVKENRFFYKYTIEIENKSGASVQLLSREWHIFGSLDTPKIVRGEGVIGDQPILKPGETYVYNSHCEMSSEIGYMKGFYTFTNLINKKDFLVQIPKFNLYFPAIFN